MKIVSLITQIIPNLKTFSHLWNTNLKSLKKSLNEVVIFIFFVHNMYSRSFITLQLNHCRCINYFNAVVLLSKQGQKALGFH